jgi:plasmid stabilization system protein ParE
MALTLIWSPQAMASFDEIIEYLNENWTENEVKKFVQKSNSIIENICLNPSMYQESEIKKYQHKAFIFKPVSLIYRYKPRKQEIELITFWNNSREQKINRL